MKSEARKQRDAKYRVPKNDCITSNDPFWRDKVNPNPWRALPSGTRELGFVTTMQIDTRPGLQRKLDDGNLYDKQPVQS